MVNVHVWWQDPFVQCWIKSWWLVHATNPCLLGQIITVLIYIFADVVSVKYPLLHIESTNSCVLSCSNPKFWSNSLKKDGDPQGERWSAESRNEIRNGIRQKRKNIKSWHRNPLKLQGCYTYKVGHLENPRQVVRNHR